MLTGLDSRVNIYQICEIDVNRIDLQFMNRREAL